MSVQWGSGNGSATSSTARSVGEVLYSERRLAVEVATLRRMLRDVRDWIAEESYTDPGEDAYCLGYNDACEDIIRIIDGGDA